MFQRSLYGVQTYVDILDYKRLEAITPLFEYYGLLDIICVVKEKLSEIRHGEEYKQYEIENVEIHFNYSFDDVYNDTKMLIIEQIKQKEYQELHAIISHYKNKEADKPFNIELKYMNLINNRMNFSFDVCLDRGNRYLCLHGGTLSIPWNY